MPLGSLYKDFKRQLQLFFSNGNFLALIIYEIASQETKSLEEFKSAKFLFAHF